MNNISNLLREVAANPKADAISYLKARMVEAADEIDRLSTPAAPVVARSDAQIVQQTEDLAKALALYEGYESTVPFMTAVNPRAIKFWKLACIAQEMLTATDPMDAASAVEDESKSGAAPVVAEGLSNKRTCGQCGQEWKGGCSQVGCYPLPAAHPVAGSPAEAERIADIIFSHLKGVNYYAHQIYEAGREIAAKFAAAKPMPASEAAKSIKDDAEIYGMLRDYRLLPCTGPERLNAIYDRIDAYFAAPAAPTDKKENL